MKTIINLILTLWLLMFHYEKAKAQDEFQITQSALTDSARARLEEFRKNKLIFYEDETYLVSKSCSGEWGGSITFKSKSTGTEYSCSATCPVSVNKLKEKYYVTNTLSHMTGSCEILEIENPSSMEVFQMPPLRREKGKKPFRYVGDTQSKSLKGTRTVISAYDTLILGSFQYNTELLHVLTTRKQTFIANVENGKFLKRQMIMTERISTYDHEVLMTTEGHLMIPISGGYLDVFGKNIKVLR